MKKTLGIIVLLLLIGSVTLSHATLMETTWTATLAPGFKTMIDGAWYNEGLEGKVFTATSIYDNGVKAYNYWTDGVNGKADTGPLKGDDVIDLGHMWSGSQTASFSYAANATVVFSDSFYALFGLMQDNTGSNWAFQKDTSDGSTFSYSGDGVMIRFNNNYMSNGMNKTTGLAVYNNNDGNWDQVKFYGWDPEISFITKVYGGDAAVPEPATIILLGSGLIGLAGFRRKLQK